MSDQIKILVVDDDVNYCSTLSKIFKMKGYAVTMANSGAAAIQLVKNDAFNVVLMDIKMPVMNGVEAYKKIKEIRPDTVVILMTAFTLDDLIRDAINEGAYAVVRKPFDIDTVINMIEKSTNGVLLAVVDDDPDIGKIMKDVLENKGYSVIACRTGEEAINIAKKRPLDIIFLDINLPVLNGLETYLEIKKINPKSTVVIMTGYRQEADELIKQAIKNGAYSCLYKPFDLNDAIQIIEEIFKGKNE